jgi:homoserine O-acetyltransferase/O-succinyltransferase
MNTATTTGTGRGHAARRPRAAGAVALLALLLAAAAPARAQAQSPAPVPGDYLIRDFTFSNGEKLPELRLHYQTVGAPERDATGRVVNAVLILHGTGGTGSGFLSPTYAGVLFVPGGILDARRYFIILPDNVGHGGSSKPSDGLHMKFPRYTYDDMVDLQYRLLTEHLGVNHLRLVMGTSMGGMHCWVWGERYPDFMDGLVPLAAVPTQIAGRNRMMRTMIQDSIRHDPEWKNGDYTAQPRGLEGAIHILLFMVSSPLQWQKAAPTRDDADAFLAQQMRTRTAANDANDMLYQFDSSRDYDPSPKLDTITAPVLAINSADDQVNPPELGLMEKLMPRVAKGRYVLIPTSDQTRGHSTHSWPAVWGAHLQAFLDGLPHR